MASTDTVAPSLKNLFAGCSLAIALATASSAEPLSLDPLLGIPGSYQMSQDEFESRFGTGKPGNPKRAHTWLTRDRSRTVFMKRDGRKGTAFTIFDGEVPCEEVVVDFTDGKISGINFSIYNRADSGKISKEEFERQFTQCGRKMGELIGSRPRQRKANARQGLQTEGWVWVSRTNGSAALERNPEAVSGKFEFLRLRVAPYGAEGPIANSMNGLNGSSIRKSDLPDFVKSANGEVWIDRIPMVDQGPKGYCVVASIQRLFEYYGIPCDQHQLAQVMDSDKNRGTNSTAVMKSLGKVDYRFKTRFSALAIPFTDGRMYRVRVRSGGEFEAGSEFKGKDFFKTVKRHIDDGIPMLWSLKLGRFPEEPAISPQTRGGHMRMIIGYTEDEKKLIFSDSWGAGHERKKMKVDHAYRATTGLYTITPTVN